MNVRVRRLARPAALLVLYGLVSVAFLGPMASSTVLSESPDLQTILPMVIQARQALEEGQFPLRVAPAEGGGIRLPVYQFYSQLPFTLGGLAYSLLTPDNPYAAYRFTFWALMTFGGFFLCRTAHLLVRDWPAAIIAGVAYIGAPYLLLNVHIRPALAEAAAQCVIPCTLYYALRTFRSPRWSWLVGSGIGWFLLAISHHITLLYTTLFLSALMLGLVGWNGKTAWRASRFVAGGVLGALLAAYFLAPSALYASSVRMSDRSSRNPQGTARLTPLPALLAPSSLPYQPLAATLSHGATPGLYPVVGWPFLVAAAAVAASLVTSRRRRERPRGAPPTRGLQLALVVLFALAVFMTWSPFDFWRLLPRVLWVVQFTYRLLAQVGWLGALLVAVALVLLLGRRLGGASLAVGVLIVGMVTGMHLRTLPRGQVQLDELVRDPSIRYDSDNWAHKVTADMARPQDLGPVYAARTSQQGTLTVADLQVPEAGRATVLPVLYYPGLLDVRDNGRPVTYAAVVGQRDLPFVVLKLPPGAHRVTVEFRGLRWANWISLAAWLAVVVALPLALTGRLRAPRMWSPRARAERARPRGRGKRRPGGDRR